MYVCIPGLQLTPNSVLCDKHFDSCEFYLGTSGKKCFNKNSIPTIVCITESAHVHISESSQVDIADGIMPNEQAC